MVINFERIQRIAEVLKVIGHPVRLQILEILEKKEPLSVNEIRTALEPSVEQSLLSHHLIKLKNKGILSSEKCGMNVHYCMKDRNILEIFRCVDNCTVIK